MIRITGDTPLQFIDLIDKHNKHIIKNNINFIFATSSCFISGFDIYNYNFFKNNLSNLKNKIDQEHVGSLFMSKNYHNFDFHYSIIPKKIKQIKARITIDYLSDYFFYLENFNELNKIQTIRKFF